MIDFAINDRCAAGTGRFLEAMAAALEVGVDGLTAIAAGSRDPVPVSSTYTVFAESEVVSHLSRGASLPDLVAGIHRSIAGRLAGLVRQVGCEGPMVMAGGVALNGGVVAEVSRALGVHVAVPECPQLAGALGAALVALGRLGSSRSAE